MDSKDIVRIVAEACDKKHAENMVILDMEQISLIADYFVICHGNNTRQIQAIANEVKTALNEKGIPSQMEGYEEARWVIVDADGLLCHIFHQDERIYYNLERLWGDASRVSLGIGQEG